MAAFDKFNVDGVYDVNEPPFTEIEIEDAFDLRQRVMPDFRLDRKDHCPHTPMCDDLKDCIEAIAWYRRHQHAIEARLAARERDDTDSPDDDDRPPDHPDRRGPRLVSRRGVATATIT